MNVNDLVLENEYTCMGFENKVRFDGSREFDGEMFYDFTHLTNAGGQFSYTDEQVEQYISE